MVDQVAGAGGQRQHEGRRRAHADGGFQFFGNAHERAQAENLDHHEVVDQHGADDDE